VQKERTLSVNIPQGWKPAPASGWRARARPGLRGGPTGDLYIFIEVKEHPIFQRDGVHLFCRVPVSMPPPPWAARSRCRRSTAARPGEGAGRQPDGQADAPARQGHARAAGGGTGDMVIELAVETPVNLTSRQRELLREFEKLSEENNPEGSSSFPRSRVSGTA
jgi:molecular chaperone DnaJ